MRDRVTKLAVVDGELCADRRANVISTLHGLLPKGPGRRRSGHIRTNGSLRSDVRRGLRVGGDVIGGGTPLRIADMTKTGTACSTNVSASVVLALCEVGRYDRDILYLCLRALVMVLHPQCGRVITLTMLKLWSAGGREFPHQSGHY